MPGRAPIAAGLVDMSGSGILITHARDLRVGELVVNRSSRHVYQVTAVGDLIELVHGKTRLTRTPKQMQTNWRRPLPWEVPGAPGSEKGSAR